MPPCRDCKKEWTFSVLEQALFVERSHNADPSRCPECRDVRKSARERGEVKGVNGRQDRTFHKATCSECGREARLPFKPKDNRAVFCTDCHRKNRIAG